MPVLNNPATFLASARATQGTGSGVDCRHTSHFAWLRWCVSGNSAVFSLDASDDAQTWLAALTVTATVGTTGYSSLAGYFPYVRANVTKVASAAGGSAQVTIFYAPGLV
jgi:hypothetical protein